MHSRQVNITLPSWVLTLQLEPGTKSEEHPGHMLRFHLRGKRMAWRVAILRASSTYLFARVL
ncbi:MAG: hypothetical protein V3W19_14100, partial [Desulfatiglandales bacterium]